MAFIFVVSMLILAGACGYGAVRSLAHYNESGDRSAVPMMLALSAAAAIALHCAIHVR